MPLTAAIPLLVPTKLAPPRLHTGLIPRERLLALLGDKPVTRLTLLVAPAGFGKSTLAAQWLFGSQDVKRNTQSADVSLSPPTHAAPLSRSPSLAPPRCAWLTLDEYDQESIYFLAYLAGAIERVVPDALPHTVALLRTAQLPAPAIVLQALLVDLSALTDPLILVLDDYHLVTAEAIHHTVSYLLRHLPDPCRLVVLSRTDPPLSLVRLRAEQQVTEVRAAQLRFTAPEAEVLVATLHGAAPDPAYVAELFQQTEGWVIALQLAALVPRDDTKRGGVQHAKHQIAEYLGEEVFAQQPGELQKVLLALAIPERFCAGLCAALLAQSASLLHTEYMLEQMTRANLLITPLEGEGDWYRFHPLFRDLLLRRLRLTVDAAQVRVLQLRAALWLETARLYVEALRLYLAAGAEDAAGALVERLLHRELGRDISNAPPAYWMRQLPADLIERRPGLALIQARVDGFYMDGKAILASIERVDALLAAPLAAEQPLPWPTFRGDLAVLRGTAIHYWQGDRAAAIDALWQGLHLGAVPSLAATGLAFLARTYAAAGRYAEGVELIRNLSDAADAPIQVTQPMRHTALCMMHELVGQMDDFAREAQYLTDALTNHNVQGAWVAVAPVFRGRAAYELADLDAAASDFAEVRAARYQTNAYSYIGCLIGLAQIALARENLAEAIVYEQEVWVFANEMGGAFLRNEALGCAVRLALAQGDLKAALAAAEQITLDTQLISRGWYAIAPPQLIRASALIASLDPTNLAQAELIITTLLAEAERTYNMRPVVCALAIYAQLRQAQGQPAAASAFLERAVRLAAPLGLIRTLVDCGPTLQPLLVGLAAQGVAPAYVQCLLSFYTTAPLAQARPTIAPVALTVPELLTRREAEILKLLAERWSDKEIAERLVVTPNTVRKHTSTIYSKLGVNSRREAVEVARSLGLIKH